MRRCAVIGAGPGGAATAAFLARAGWEVDVYERRAGIEQKICGEMLSPACRQILADLNAWRIIGDSVRSHSILLVGRRGSSLKLDFGRSQEELPCTIPRPILDGALVEVARDAGARFHWSRSVELGELNEVDLVVGADGRQSRVARELGLARSTPHRLRNCAILAYFETSEGKSLDQVEMHATDWGYAGLNPTPDGYVNVIAVLENGRLRSMLRSSSPRKRGDEGLVELLTELTQGQSATPGLRARLAGAQAVTARGRRAWTVGSMAWVPRSVARGRHALVGDSAGFVDPFTGEGIFHALASAKALAGFVCAGPGIERALERYDEWHQCAFGPENRFCERLQKAMRYGRVMDYGLRQLARKPALAKVLAEAVADRAPVERVLSPWYWAKVMMPGVSA